MTKDNLRWVYARDMVWKIRWHDSSVTTAATAQGVLDKVRAEQWRTMNDQQFRFELCHRTLVLTDVAVDPTLPTEELVKALAAAGAFELLESA